MESAAMLESRFRGCLFGGALGDALGYPVEFLGEKAIAKFYPDESAGLPVTNGRAMISDDTQMTLYTAAGLLYGMTRTGKVPEPGDIWTAYREWLATQGDRSRLDGAPRIWLTRVPAMYALRAPGQTCLSAIHDLPDGGSMESPANSSRGCGGVMRVAPIGLFSYHRTGLDACLFSAQAAALTHGHPLGYASAAVFGQLIHEITWHSSGIGTPEDLRTRIRHAARTAAKKLPAAGALIEGIERALTLATDSSVSDTEGIHRLGEGFLGDEALCIALFCAARHSNSFPRGVLAAVRHRGDSDSTGALCGQILGAWLGFSAVRAAYDLEYLDLCPVISTLAQDLFTAAFSGAPGKDARWLRKYRAGEPPEM